MTDYTQPPVSPPPIRGLFRGRQSPAEQDRLLALRGVELLQEILSLFDRDPHTAKMLLGFEIERRRRHPLVDVELVARKIHGFTDGVAIVAHLQNADRSVIHASDVYQSLELTDLEIPWVARRVAENIGHFLAEHLVEPIAVQIRDRAAEQDIKIGDKA